MEVETTATGSAKPVQREPLAHNAPPLSPDAQPSKKKQKRNKPTLSCEECVERKTKCDRGRPQCLACVKRQSSCRYSEAANAMASAESGDTRPGSKSRKQGKPSLGEVGNGPLPPQIPTPRPQHRSVSISSTSSSPFLLSNIPYSNHSPSIFFGLGSEHPFTNYWTSQGGLPEVIGVLPSKDQADILVAKFFDAVDPVYPMIHKRNFYAEYERFWSLPLPEKQAADPMLVALHFVVYAMATQFIQTSSDQERAQIAEFYVSASHQALRLAGYLSRVSVRTIQAMVFICYFLMNDNHASDAWAFGGVLMRQAYAMGLNRDPDIISPRCSLSDKHQRRKVWQAVLFQDTFLTVLLKLPPTATFSDVQVESLTDDLGDLGLNGNPSNGSPEAIMNPMSISSIAPMADPHPPYELSDRQYIRSMWRMANLVQQTVCTPRSLGLSLTKSPREKYTLIASYHKLFSSFPSVLKTSDQATVAGLATNSPRQLRQNLFFRSNYWHCVMIIQADENEAGGVVCDVRGALEAARMALASFFAFWEYLPVDVGVWWVFQHRAFEEALLMARMLAVQEKPLSSDSPATTPAADPLFMLAKADARKTLDILEHVGNVAPDMQKTRTDVLRTAFEAITW